MRNHCFPSEIRRCLTVFFTRVQFIFSLLNGTVGYYLQEIDGLPWNYLFGRRTYFIKKRPRTKRFLCRICPIDRLLLLLAFSHVAAGYVTCIASQNAIINMKYSICTSTLICLLFLALSLYRADFYCLRYFCFSFGSDNTLRILYISFYIYIWCVWV